MKTASNMLHIKYSSAKTIMNTFLKFGRIQKKLTRDKRGDQQKVVIDGQKNGNVKKQVIFFWAILIGRL